MKDCKIVQDLLPNYIENLTSEETNLFIEKHLNECEDCKKIYETMKKDYKIENEKRDGREVEYIKKYNKKMKLWKKILLIVFVLFIIYLVSVVYKLSILTQIGKKYKISDNTNNYYYYSISNDTLMEYFKKDGIIKMHVRQSRGNGDITFWKDSNTGEQLIFWNEARLYDKAEGGIIESAPFSAFDSTDFSTRIMIAAHPFMFIGIQNYKITASNHVWNLVNVDGTWYHLDLTWDDPVVSDGTEFLEHTYFMIDTNTLQTVEKTQHNFNNTRYKEFN